jgi:hypothetical protein
LSIPGGEVLSIRVESDARVRAQPREKQMATVVKGPKRRNSLAPGYHPERPAAPPQNLKLVEPEPPSAESVESAGPNTLVAVVPTGDVTFAWGPTLVTLRKGAVVLLEPAQIKMLESLGVVPRTQ